MYHTYILFGTAYIYHWWLNWPPNAAGIYKAVTHAVTHAIYFYKHN